MSRAWSCESLEQGVHLVARDADPKHLPAATDLATSALDAEEASLMQQIQADPTCHPFFKGFSYLL